jgi:aryl-alcohol dehydrogenase-like predicted oxidoreductase
MMDRSVPPFAPRRSLGRTGFVATRLGIGDLADRSVPFEQGVATARRALEAGLNVIDTAPGYESGYSEEIVGEAVRPFRERVFVVDKIDDLRSEVAPQVEASLRRLRMEAADAFVFHGVSAMADWERLAAPGGGLDQLDACRAAGKVRFRGVSSHHPDVLRAAIEAGACDVVLFAVGPWCDARYVDEILPLARAHGAGTICFKTFGAGKLLGDTSGYGRPLAPRPRGKVSSGGRTDDAAPAARPRLTVRECVHYTLTADPDVALLGLSFPNEQDAAFEAALDFRPLAPDDMAALRARAAAAIAGKGPCWWNPGA